MSYENKNELRELHPHPEDLDRYALGGLGLPPGACRRIAAHLRTGCPHCREVLEKKLTAVVRMGEQEAAKVLPWPRPHPGDEEIRSRRFLQKLKERAYAHALEEAEAPGLLEELLKQPPGRRRMILQNSLRFRTWGLANLLLERCREVRSKDLDEAQELAELALVMADHLPSEHRLLGLAQDLKALAWAQLGNLHRIRSDYQQAEGAFQVVETHLDNASGDPLVEAEILDLKATLRGDQRRFEEADALFRRALKLYGELKDDLRYAHTLNNRAKLLADMGRQDAAIKVLQKALLRIDPEEDPRLYYFIQHNLLDDLVEVGRLQDARALLPKVQRTAAKLAHPLPLLRLRWIEGKLAQAEGEYRQAEATYLEVRQGFIDHEIGYDAALVSLDLAALYAQVERAEEVKRLAREMFPIFQSREIHREAMVALLVFQQAAEIDEASSALIDEVKSYLQAARGKPHLRFRQDRA